VKGEEKVRRKGWNQEGKTRGIPVGLVMQDGPPLVEERRKVYRAMSWPNQGITKEEERIEKTTDAPLKLHFCVQTGAR